jgi:outer membrane protein assembly factor BamB
VRLSDGQELWNYEIGQPVESSPAVADGKFVVGSNDGSVYCFGVKK